LCDKTNGREQGKTSIHNIKELIEDSQEIQVVLAMNSASEVYKFGEPFHKFELQREEWFRINEGNLSGYLFQIYGGTLCSREQCLYL
jgi:hypothetical protein